jgi:hypothetical protein
MVFMSTQILANNMVTRGFLKLEEKEILGLA